MRPQLLRYLQRTVPIRQYHVASGLPKTIHAAVMRPNQPVQVEDFQMPTELAAGSLIMKVTYSEICGTDVHLQQGKLAGVPYPIVPGHVAVGEIAAMSTPINDFSGQQFKEGDTVTYLDVNETCHACPSCLVHKQSTRCPSRRVYGITYPTEHATAMTKDHRVPMGGWSTYMYLAPGTKLLRLPRDLDAKTLIAGGCGLNTALHAVDRAELMLGNSVVVLGAGPVGQSCIAFAALSGATTIVAVDSESSRLDYATRMGATHTISLRELPDLSQRIRHLNTILGSSGADVTIEASGQPIAVSQALDYTRDGGRCVVVGQYTDLGEVGINPHTQINKKHVEIRGCWGSDLSHYYRALEVMSVKHQAVPWLQMIGGEYNLSNINDGLQAIKERKMVKAIVNPHAG